MRILVIDNTNLTNQSSGQAFVSFNTYSRLNRYIEVYYLTECEKRSHKEYPFKLYCVNKRFHGILGKIELIRFIPKVVSLIRKINPTLIIVEHIYSLPFIGLLVAKMLRRPVIYHCHGIELELAKGSPYYSQLYIKFIEYIFFKYSDLILTMSDRDKVIIKALYRIDDKKITTLPPVVRKINCFDKQKHRIKIGLPVNATVAIFHGSLDYGPNKEAVQYIINELAPRVPDMLFLIVGGSNTFKPEVVNNVIFTGYVENLEDYLCSADVGLAPLFSGTGIKTKILDYLAAGLPIVTTPKGIEGIERIAIQYPVFIIKDKNPISFVDALRKASKVNRYTFKETFAIEKAYLESLIKLKLWYQ